MKMTDYQAGREDGLLMAKRLVEEGGLGRLEDEIKYRNLTGIHTGLVQKELEKTTRQIKMTTLDTVLLLEISSIRDEYDFGAVRLKRLIDRMERKAQALIGDMATWEDFRQTIQEELGIEIDVWQQEGKIYLTKQGAQNEKKR